MPTVAAMSGVQYQLQTAATSGNGNVVSPPSSFRYHTIIIDAAAGVTAGAIQVESAVIDTYAGTWAQVGGGPISVTGMAEVIYNFEGMFSFLRARISTNIAGGSAPSVTVTYVGSK